MITTAAFIAADAYLSVHDDEYDGESMGILVFLVVFMYFDYQMALVIA